MKKQRGFTLVELVALVLSLLAVGGWIANIVKFAHMDFAAVTGMLVLRGIGIFIAPLGVVLGFI